MIIITILLALTLDDVIDTWFGVFVPFWFLNLVWFMTGFIHAPGDKQGFMSLKSN